MEVSVYHNPSKGQILPSPFLVQQTVCPALYENI